MVDRLWRISSTSGLRVVGASVLAASLLAGCAVGPDYQPPRLPIPTAWAATGSATTPKPPELADWWMRFDDPLLTAIIDEAVKTNLDVRTAKANVREARATYRQSVGSLWPSVDGSGSYTRAKNGSNVSSGGDITVSRAFDQYNAGLDASWEIDLFGANRRSVEAAKYGLDAAEEELRNTLLTLIGDVATNYVSARGYQARIALAKRTAASQRETLGLTETKFREGSASRLDVASAKGQANATEANIPALQTSYAEAVNRLSILTGRAPGALTDRMRTVKPVPSPPLPVATGIPAQTLLNRPDVRVAERQLAQSTAQIGQAQAARFPNVSLTGAISTSGVEVGDLAQNSSISWSFGPSLSVPVFNAGELKAAVDASKAVRDQSYLAYFSTVLTALEDVENATVALSQDQIRRRKLAAAARAYRDAVDLSRTQYRAGASSFLDVLDAERSLYSAEDSLIESRVSIATDYIALNKALGGGWDGTIDTIAPEIAHDDMGPRLAKTILPPLPPIAP
ncbi:efflux transporter outer membrane subunit [Amorphus sp. 3PC139-8]|uniref:efflux transporter outer membrane subunit n=1 Tax=Amorphus sp. 3PC139-8 TaxID=2735676 RepID=UPI00345D9DF7